MDLLGRQIITTLKPHDGGQSYFVMITREKLRTLVLNVKQNWLDSDFEENLDRILDSGLVNYENSDDNYRPAYPIVAAILERCVDSCLYGSSYEKTRREAKRLKNKYKPFVR